MHGWVPPAVKSERCANRVKSDDECPSGMTQMARFTEGQDNVPYTACEDLSRSNGDLVLLAPADPSAERFVFRKTAESLFGGAQFSADMSRVWASKTDLLRDTFLNQSRAEGRDVTFAEIADAISPLLLNGGTLTSQAAKSTPSHVNVHSFTSSRLSLAHPAFDHKGGDAIIGDNDYPSMSQMPSKCKCSRSLCVFFRRSSKQRLHRRKEQGGVQGRACVPMDGHLVPSEQHPHGPDRRVPACTALRLRATGWWLHHDGHSA